VRVPPGSPDQTAVPRPSAARTPHSPRRPDVPFVGCLKRRSLGLRKERTSPSSHPPGPDATGGPAEAGPPVHRVRLLGPVSCYETFGYPVDFQPVVGVAVALHVVVVAPFRAPYEVPLGFVPTVVLELLVASIQHTFVEL